MSVPSGVRGHRRELAASRWEGRPQHDEFFGTARTVLAVVFLVGGAATLVYLGSRQRRLDAPENTRGAACSPSLGGAAS